jgi:regulator of sigma E protease
MDFLPNLTNLPVTWLIWVAIVFLIALSIIVFVHEYGHFKVARLCGIKIDTFSVGFGREIFGFNDRYGTRWKLGWLPIGGFVRFEGDMNAASFPAEGAKSEAAPGSFHSKPIWQRAAVVAAGPIANFVLAFFIFAASAMVIGLSYAEPRIGRIAEGSAAEAVGLKTGDLIVSINGKAIESFNDIVETVQFLRGQKVDVVVNRAGETLTFMPVIGEQKIKDSWAGELKVGLLGVGTAENQKILHETKSLWNSAAYGIDRVEFFMSATLKFVGKMFVGTESVSNLGGVTSMARAAGQAADSGFANYVYLIGFLSVSIGLVNLFPIPMLDGGHLVFYAIEAVRGKPLGEKAQEWSFKVGFALVVGLMLLGNGNDLMLRILPNVFGTAAP